MNATVAEPIAAKVSLISPALDPGSTVERHWIAGPDGPRGACAALGTGQLEFLDIECARNPLANESV